MEKNKMMRASLALFSAFVLAACSQDGGSAEDTSSEAETTETAASGETAETELQDGEYSLVELNEDKGHTVHHSIVVEGGQIVESNFGYTDTDGNEKYDNEEYNTTMENASGISYADAQDQLNEKLVETQDPDQVDIVTGATSSSESFVEYSKQLVEAAKDGDTTLIEVDNAVEE